jgi:hypothetical protein
MQILMSDPKQQQQDSWKALQAELGLTPEEPESKPKEPAALAPSEPTAKKVAPPASIWDSDPPGANEPLPNESPFVEGSMTANVEIPEEAETEIADEPEPAAAGSDHEVEVGEAPEEIPEADAEPEAEEEKPRRRRRGRRRRRSDSGAPEEGAEGPEALEESAADDPGNDDTGEEEGEAEAETEPFTDWNVPSWQELIGSLYRPER